MVSSTTRKIISLAISLLVVVISLTGIALGATAPTVTSPTRYTPGFTGAPGKMARDAAGNFYATDFWGKGIVKLDRQLANPGFLKTSGRPTAVAALKDGRLVVAMSKPTVKVVFYDQSSGSETPFDTTAYNPVAITVDGAGYIYVLDSGDLISASQSSANFARVRVYSSAGTYLDSFGSRLTSDANWSAGGQFKQPLAVAYEKEANQIVVVDALTGRIQYFDAYNGTVGSCVYRKNIGATAGRVQQPAPGSLATFYNPVDVAFEYNGTALFRMYIAERGHDQVTVVNAEVAGTYGTLLSRIDASTLTGADMKLPSAVLFEKTATGGVLYVNNEATSAPANILKLSINGGSVPATTVTLNINAVPPTAPGSPITVSGTTSPANAVTCSVNGGDGFLANGTATWDVSLTLASGQNYILCQSTSGGVTSYKEAYTYLGSLPQETVTITSPAAGLYTKDVSLPFTGTTGNANAIVKLENSLGGSVTVTSDASKNWSAVLSVASSTFAEGSNAITVTAWKPGTSSVSNPAYVTVVADYTPPTVNISFVNNNAVTNNAIQNLDGIIYDANFATVEVNDVVVPAKAIVTLAGSNTYFSTPVTLNRGLNTVRVKATDEAGYVTIVNRNVTLKPENVGITVDLPADNSYRTAPATVTANGTSAAAFTNIDACGATAIPSGGAWSTAALGVTDGFLSCQFIASGAGVDTVTEKRTINTNASYKQLAITSPVADLATKNGTVTVSGTVPADSPIPQIQINGAVAVPVTTYTAGTGVFSHDVVLEQGLNSVKIIADAATTAVRNIIYDTTLPDIGIQADSRPMPIMITGSVEPSAKFTQIKVIPNVTIPLSVISFDPYDGLGTVTWHANLNGYAYSEISFVAEDPAGNTTELKYLKGIPTGDIDGDGVVRLADALATLRHIAKTETISDSNKFFNGDVGGLINGRASRDGVIDVTDSVLILNKAYGLMNW